MLIKRLALVCALLLSLLLPTLLQAERPIRQKNGADGRGVMLPVTATEQPVQETNSMDAQLITADFRFGFKLYSELLQHNGDRNIFISPLSIAFALQMTYNGASEATRQAMARTLELQGLKLHDLNAANGRLKSALESLDPKVQLEIANSLWARQGIELLPAFIEQNKTSYHAEVQALDFLSPNAPGKINSWVSDKTHGKIQKIVDQISPDTLLYLINAIYFKGKWATQFNPAQTQEENFTLANQSEKRVPMMRQSGRYPYFENEKFQAVSLPYGDKRISMLIFLPKSGTALGEFHRMLTAENWVGWMNQLRETKGNIRLPRFKVEYETSLKPALSALGMASAFDQRADFSQMVAPPTRAFISDVKHKTFVEVNEEGTEAAAVTSTEMQTVSLKPQENFEMVVNHPFFFVLQDNRSGAILFMGTITTP
jgi:serpin B